jgi:predicted nucleotidyltransferase component of viral defense system
MEFFRLTQDFYLTGGTALSAFYLHHPNSVDLDLFTHDDYAFQRVDDLTGQISMKLNLDCETVRLTSYFKHFRVGLMETLNITSHECSNEELSRLFQRSRQVYFEETPVYDANDIPRDEKTECAGARNYCR